MNDKQKEEIREEFNQSVEYLITNEAVIDWWLSKIDSLLTSQRDSLVEKIKKHPFENTNFEQVIEEVITLIKQNK